jgi:hypothetical protein
VGPFASSVSGDDGVGVDQLGHRYEDTPLDPLTSTCYTREQYEKVLKNDPATIVVLYKMPSEDIVNG